MHKADRQRPEALVPAESPNRILVQPFYCESFPSPVTMVFPAGTLPSLAVVK